MVARTRATIDALRRRAAGMHPAAWLVLLASVIFMAVFGSLGVQNHRNFGTWSYDMGIYDQAVWLLSRGGDTFMSVRGLDVWGHHVNPVLYLLVPFYWLGAGPSFLYVVQAIALGAAAWPAYLIARDRFANPWMGLVWGVVVLLYAPLQWISWAMFHPEAFVITPMLYAWWFAGRERWRWAYAMVLLALCAREDVALAVAMMGLVLPWHLRRSPQRRAVLLRCGGLVALGVVWYLVATRFVLPWFNGGKEPFYVTYFYGNYGSNVPEILSNVVSNPSWVWRDATAPDRLEFYRQLSWPLGWMHLLHPLGLLMAAPQMLASVIGLSPYARMIRYQYTSVMIAPLVISAIHGSRLLWRHRYLKAALPAALLVSAYVTNVMWSPSPLNRRDSQVWAVELPRTESLREAVALVPDGASVSATYQLLPHLTHRRHAYDWPNPFLVSVWGNDDCDRLPDPATIEYVVLDKTQIGVGNFDLFDAMIVEGGPFEVIYESTSVVVLRRTGTSVAVDVAPQEASCSLLDLRYPDR
jgi:uncharacterized membrane protein